MKNRILMLLIAVTLIYLVLPDLSSAIPAFARRYKISCSTCHAPMPKLKPYGDEFAGNGFIIKEDEKERDYISAGDDLLWLNKEFPLAVRFDAYAVLDQEKPVDKDLQIPWGVKLLSGGTLYKSIGYYFYFYMSERGEVAGIEDAYIHFNDIAGQPLDILVGQFQTCDPLMKRELRLTFEDYKVFGQKLGLSQTNLTYDRGLMVTYGIEKTGTDLIGMLVNGNGKGMADEATKKFDSDQFKNFGLRLKQGIGKFMNIGGFYYQGKESLNAFENKVTYWGPDLNLSVGPIEVTAQYLEREDSNPWFAEAGKNETLKGTVVEVIYSPQLDRSRFFLIGLYNQMDFSSPLVGHNYQSATLSGTYLLTRNLRLVAEYTRDLEMEQNRFILGLVSGF